MYTAKENTSNKVSFLAKWEAYFCFAYTASMSGFNMCLLKHTYWYAKSVRLWQVD